VTSKAELIIHIYLSGVRRLDKCHYFREREKKKLLNVLEHC